MLEFFRKYQRYFFVLITIVIVISFSFFGTYNTLSESSFREQIAFTPLDGSSVTRHELDEMLLFLTTDAEDKQLYGGAWGANFLNDGVIKKDFFETGLAEQLAAAYPNELQIDLMPRLEKERRYSLYTHPQARFIGTESVWSYFAPEMNTAFNSLRLSSDPLSPEAFKARVSLFLMQRQLPAPLLHQVLRYQEKQYGWLKPDPNLDSTDLSLFGYHTVEEWFGPRFSRLVAQFIVNAAQMAEMKGYRVSKTEALADLMRNSEISYQQLQRTANLGVKNSQEYFQEQLRRLGMDQNMATKAWQQVLLFRRYFQDQGNAVFVDPLTYQKFNDYALATVEGTLYQLPKPFRLNSFKALQKFEIYIDAIGKRSADEKAALQLPRTFYSETELAKNVPELMQKRYLLEVAQVDKRTLESSVSLKESWEWESSGKGWELLKKEFPELGLKIETNPEERLHALDSLDSQMRSRVDVFARQSIVSEHPEWLKKSLQQAKVEEQHVSLSLKGGQTPFVGLEGNEKLMHLLDAAALPQLANKDNDSSTANEALSDFTADNRHYYRIALIARSPQYEVMTFAQADQSGALDTLLAKRLEAHYLKIREADPLPFQTDSKTWKPFADVQEVVAARYFEKTLNAIKKEIVAAAPEKINDHSSSDTLATLRLYSYMQDLKEKLMSKPLEASHWIQGAAQESLGNQLLPQSSDLAEQWKLEHKIYKTSRSSMDHLLDKKELFSLAENGWTNVNAPPNGDLNFFQLQRKINGADQKALATQIAHIRKMLSDDAQQKLMTQLLGEIKAKEAISLKYLNQTNPE